MQELLGLASGAPVSTVLLLVMVGASLIGLYAAPAMLERNLFRPYWLLPKRQYATLVTSGFLHADVPHLFFNGFTFWAFAFGLERAIGSLSFLALYAFGLLASDAGTWFKHRRNPTYQSLGASGAILAVLFASIIYFPGASLFIFPLPVPLPAPLFAVAYLGYSYYAARQGQGRINHDAHLTGAIAGLVFVGLTDPAAFARALRSVFG
jgi:membrane associated rhomboid family serine protease